MTGFIQAVTTTETREDAEKIARIVVEQRLAACVQVLGPITSTYWWQGSIETADEWMCLMKSRQDLFDQLVRAIKAVHPYTVPEILAFPVVAGNPEYLSWLGQEVELGLSNKYD